MKENESRPCAGTQAATRKISPRQSVSEKDEVCKCFEVGEYIIYQNGDRFELGRIARVESNGAFVCYHCGETAAKTPFDLMHKLTNAYAIKDTMLGGSRFERQRDATP